MDPLLHTSTSLPHCGPAQRGPAHRRFRKEDACLLETQSGAVGPVY